MLGTGDTVYVIDPDVAVHEALAALIESSDADVECYRTAEEFLLTPSPFRDKCGCLLVAVDLAGMGGLALIRQLQEHTESFPVIVLASTADRDVADQAMKAGAVDVLYKPLTTEPLLDRLYAAVHRSGYHATQANS